MADGSAELMIEGRFRRIALDIAKLNPDSREGHSKPPGQEIQIDGEVHDQGDLNGLEGAILKIDGVGEFKVGFYTPTRFRGALVRKAD